MDVFIEILGYIKKEEKESTEGVWSLFDNDVFHMPSKT